MCSDKNNFNDLKIKCNFSSKINPAADLCGNNTQGRMTPYLQICVLVKGETLLLMKHRRLECETWFQLRVRWFGV